MGKYGKILLIMTLLSGNGLADSQEFLVAATYIGPGNPSPFSPQLWVHVTNEKFTSIDFREKIKSSQLLVDGRPLTRLDEPFEGPPGLAPKGSWEGCLSLEAYAPNGLEAGSHRLQLKMGLSVSEVVRVKIPSRVPPAAAVKDRLRQVRDLVDAMPAQLLKSCVENWFTETDGGLSSLYQSRYYVVPGVKVLIAYDDSPPEPHVKGRIRIYSESRVAD